MEIFKYILILLSCSVICIVICRRLHLPAIIGYLSVGIFVGPGGLGWLPTLEEMHLLAEFGIVFLMFTLGLEFSVPRLIATKKTLLGVGGMQVLICTIAATYVTWFFGLSVIQSIVIGGGVSLSSTAVAIKLLSEQKEQHTTHGSTTISILLFQDLAAVFFLILVPAVSGVSDEPLTLTVLLTIGKGIVAAVGMALIGLWILRPLFHEVAKAHSTELFMMATLLVALSASGITYYLDLSFALGAFLAGLMLGETEFRHQIELDIRPFRDVLLGLFFVVIGANLQLSVLPEFWDKVLLIVAALIIGKGILIFGIVKIFAKCSLRSALRSGIILAHGGEFTFVIMTEAFKNHLISESYRGILFSAVVISTLIAPLLIKYNRQISYLLYKGKTGGKAITESTTHKLSDRAAELKQHVILCGYGRVGQILARFLDQENIPWLALDMDPMRLSKSSIAGEHAFFGDATQPDTLSAAGLARARMVVVTFSNEVAGLDVVKHVRGMRLDVPLFVRTRDDTNLEAFQEAGATEVVPESLEGSIMLGSHLLLTLGVPTNKVMSKMRRIHTDRYQVLRGTYRGLDDVSHFDEDQQSRRSLHSIFVPEGSASIGKTLSSLLTDENEFSIRALTRHSKRTPDPDLDTKIDIGDVIVIYATPEETVIMEEKILNGD